MLIIKNLWKPVTVAIVILAVFAFGIFRQKILAGCIGTPCNELRSMQWEGIFGPIIGVCGAFLAANYSFKRELRARDRENRQPIIKRYVNSPWNCRHPV